MPSPETTSPETFAADAVTTGTADPLALARLYSVGVFAVPQAQLFFAGGQYIRTPTGPRILVDDRLVGVDALDVVAHELAHHLVWLRCVDTDDEEAFCARVAAVWLGDLLPRSASRIKKPHPLPLDEPIQVDRPLDDRLVLAALVAA